MNLPLQFAAFIIALLMPMGGAANTEISTIRPTKLVLKPTISQIEPARDFKKLELAPYPYSPAGTYNSSGYAPRNCTSYMASRKQIPQNWSHAKHWAAQARAIGKTVSSTPIVGTIAQTTKGKYGHVALTLKIQGHRVYIAEANYDYRGSIRERWANVSDFVYIYI